MKTTRILLLSATFLLFPWCVSQLFSQNENPSEGGKKIVITKRSVDADGTETTETLVKKGKAAENFDVDKYLRENRSDKTQVEVQITDDNGDERSVVVKRSKGDRGDGDSYGGYSGYQGYSGYGGYNYAGCEDNGAFLGVDEDSDEDEDKPGLVVNVVRGSAADLAGLRDNDKILTLNDTKTDRWSDLSKFVNAAKPGDKVKITYERNGKRATAEATLTKRSEVKKAEKTEKGFLGVSDDEEDDENDEPGVAVSITDESAADKAGLEDGDVIFQLNDVAIADFEDISDVMAYTKPGEKMSVTYERDGKRATVDVTLGEQRNDWDNWNTNNWNSSNWSPETWNITGDCTVNVREKDACLGVYSEDFDDESSRQGARISDFTTESAARESELKQGDVITAINNVEVKGQDALWDEIAKYEVGDKVNVSYLRDGQPANVKATLKACRDNASRVEVWGSDDDKDQKLKRSFYTWNWGSADEKRLRERKIISIRRGEGDGTKVNASPAQPAAADRSLALQAFRAYPNPTQGQVTVEFKGEAKETVVSLFDLSGRQLFREELNAFDGNYQQQFDLSEYAKGTIVVHVQQSGKVFTEQLVVN
jgi:serine protease Do